MRIGYNEAIVYGIHQEQMMTELLHKNRLTKANAVRNHMDNESPIESESEKSMPTSGPGPAENPTGKSL